MQAALPALIAVLLVSMISLVGIVLFFFNEATMGKLLLPLVSFSTGAILGDVFIHLLPEIVEGVGAGPLMFGGVLAGIVFSFTVEKIIHWRHCHLLPGDQREHEHCHSAGTMSNIGDGIHNFMDGLIIASSFLAGIPAGIATTVAVVLHEIPSEIGNFAVMLHDGFSRRRALLWNFLSALTAVLGAVVVLAGSASALSLNQYMLPFAAGNLLYIAGSDLIPELHREEGLRKAFFQLLCMVGGIAIMGVMLFLE